MAIIVLATQQLLQNELLLPLHVLIGAVTYTGIIRRMKILNEEDAQLIKGIFGEKNNKEHSQNHEHTIVNSYL